MCYTKTNINEFCLSSEDILAKELSLFIGLTLGDAKMFAKDNDYGIENITVTAPPRMVIAEYEDSFRVLRVSAVQDKKLSILICKPL